MSIVSISFWACQEEITGDTDPSLASKTENVLLATNSIKDQLASKVAKNIAASLGDPMVLDFMKEKANERFDGDFNFLIENTKDESLNVGFDDVNKRSRSFGSIVSGINLSDKRLSDTVDSFLDSIARFHPLLQVFVPEFSEENFRTQGTDYLVAYIPRKIKNGVIPAYDKNGNYHELSSTEIPEIPVIVIKENERVTAIPKGNNASNRILDCPILAGAIFENDYNSYYYTEDVYYSQNLCIGGGGPVDGAPVNPTCDRDSNSGKDRLNRLKFNSMQDFRDVNEWFDGGQEIEVTITFAISNGNISSVKKFWTGSDSDFKDCGLFNCNTQWFYLGNAEIVTWNPTTYGDAMLYVWIEKDPGDPIELSNTFSSSFPGVGGAPGTNFSTTVKQTITDEDDELGEAIVEYCDQTTGDGNEYNSVVGRIRFKVKQ
ncbi:hypothetical protein [Algoriphagus marinus]|uniref:hypothetical protein n=1 Tax=Algoriphagus marinus TaxID=1925762 RepID=UPI00094B8FB7|nr:hypothetical protein [Algoriphagus marinus]